ncbi:MAG: cation transporter [Actinobacteria bacterium]|nr:cation transporter [Actinomycetota bacterium]
MLVDLGQWQKRDGADVGHDHGVSAAGAHRSRLLIVLGISVTVLVVELIGAYVTGSLALAADAAHMFTDVAGILLAVLAVTFGARPASPKRTFGYYRLEILAAVVNAVLLFTVAIFIFIEAYRRWSDPAEIEGGLMLAFAVVGLVANIAGLVLLRAGSRESLNVKGAYLEVLGDALGSIAVIAAAIVIWATGWLQADSVASVLVALMILPRTWKLLSEAIDVLLEATPKGMDLMEVRRHILDQPGVLACHDLHVWTVTSGMPVMSVHVVVDDEILREGGSAPLLTALGECLGGCFDVEHCTFQLEPADHEPEPHAHE